MIESIEQKQNKITSMGNSGCKLELLQNDIFAIQKTALSPAYFERLNSQRIKQQIFLCPIPGIQVPEILSFDQRSFTMELLPMLDAIEFFERSEPKVIQARINLLIAFVRWEISHSTVKGLDSSLFIAKLQTIKSVTAKDTWQFYYAAYEEVFTRNMPAEMLFSIGNCHGDLTFSNVMFSMRENRIGLIDFLDSFIDSPLVDIAKLLQDARFHWSSYRFPFAHDRGKIYIVDAWIDKILSEEFASEISSLQFWIIEMMNYFRIIPYINSPEDHQYLVNILAQISFRKEEIR